MDNQFIIMTAKASMPNSCFGSYSYMKVAVVQILKSGYKPKQIHPNNKKIKIIRIWDRLYAGSTKNCAFEKAMVQAKELCTQLNGE